MVWAEVTFKETIRFNSLSFFYEKGNPREK
jgi:hypothetical protein